MRAVHERGPSVRRRMSMAVTALWAAFAISAAASPSWAAPPRIVPQGNSFRLIVQGKPMLMLGGELGNSSASSADYMAPHWQRLHDMHLNTVLAPVSWELIEPVEGHWNFSNVDLLIENARKHDLHLVLLWFGAWKNSMSSYVPAWVKRDQRRFPRAQLLNGQGAEILSAFSSDALAADARAYRALLDHIRAIDGERNTVLMVQVENEIGMLPVARDYGPAATAAFQSPVPQPLVDYLVAHHATLTPQLKSLWEAHGGLRHGNWADLFGPGNGAEEIFTAWYYARYADQIATAGQAAYDLPMYVNVALNRPGKAPGEYPSGGPLPHLIDIWKAGAPHIDMLSPDIYFPNFSDLAARYRRPDNPLFIPEANRADNPNVQANALYAIGTLGAMGYSPFSIESVDDRPNAITPLYDLLTQLAPAILADTGTGRMAGFQPRTLFDGTVIAEPQSADIGGYRFTVRFASPQGSDEDGEAHHAALILQTGPEDYLIAGTGVVVSFTPLGDGPPLAGIDNAWEGHFDATGAWKPGRLLNGDQTNQGRFILLSPGEMQIQKIRLYRYR